MRRIVSKWQLIEWILQGYDPQDKEWLRDMFAKRLSDETLAKQFNLTILRKGTFA